MTDEAVLRIGDFKELVLTAVDAAGAAYDISGTSEIVFVIAAKRGGPTLLRKTLSAGGGVEITSAIEGEFTVTLNEADTAALTPRLHFFEVTLEDVSGKPTTLEFSPNTLDVLASQRLMEGP